MRLSRRSRRRRCWALRLPSRRLPKPPQRWKKRPPEPQDSDHHGAAQSDDEDQEMPFWVDCSPDESLVPPLPVPESTPSQGGSKASPDSETAEVAKSADTAVLPELEELKEGPKSPGLMFHVVPSTQNLDGPSASKEERVEVTPEAARDMAFDSLELFYRTSTARPEEVRRRDAKAGFTLSRYYVNDEPAASKQKTGQAQGKTGLMSDDGYLTKEGAKRFCVVCCGSNHRAYECPETRCFICWETGHNTKNCPNDKLKCTRCKRNGHVEEVCPIKMLRAAEKKQQWTEVRCLVCRAQGHLACDGTGKWWGGSRWEEAEEVSEGEDGDEGKEEVEQTSSKQNDTNKAMRMAKLLGRSRADGSGRAEARTEGLERPKTNSKWDYQEDRETWDYAWRKWDWQGQWSTGKSWHNNGHDGGRHKQWGGSQHDHGNAQSALQKKLERQKGRSGHVASTGLNHKQAKSRPLPNKQNSSKSRSHQNSVPAMRIRDKPSARAERRARQRKRR